MGNDSKKLKKYLRKKLNYNSWKQLLEFMKFPHNIKKTFEHRFPQTFILKFAESSNKNLQKLLFLYVLPPF